MALSRGFSITKDRLTEKPRSLLTTIPPARMERHSRKSSRVKSYGKYQRDSVNFRAERLCLLEQKEGCGERLATGRQEKRTDRAKFAGWILAKCSSLLSLWGTALPSSWCRNEEPSPMQTSFLSQLCVSLTVGELLPLFSELSAVSANDTHVKRALGVAYCGLLLDFRALCPELRHYLLSLLL